MPRITGGTGLLTALGAALLLGAAAPAASAAPETGGTALPDPSARLQNIAVAPALEGATGALGYAVKPAKDMRIDPFAQSPTDVLNNGVSVEPDNGLKPISSSVLTRPLSDGGGARDLPQVGPLLGVLPG
ncbi:hypothetical protein [Saccharothrix sp. ST-888]|uniref:hypothetical protein n=1 Tax=Saccharothrix sp. ST-888 TaxID=1427391 RepID=UPI0005ECDDBE|nr:hypothetical protein [Saccharothrix sp. ST-888]KJK56266.1 hypothetical protein UK12_23520 [Saccharothrix sp. ST-888]